MGFVPSVAFEIFCNSIKLYKTDTQCKQTSKLMVWWRDR